MKSKSFYSSLLFPKGNQCQYLVFCDLFQKTTKIEGMGDQTQVMCAHTYISTYCALMATSSLWIISLTNPGDHPGLGWVVSRCWEGKVRKRNQMSPVPEGKSEWGGDAGKLGEASTDKGAECIPLDWCDRRSWLLSLGPFSRLKSSFYTKTLPFWFYFQISKITFERSSLVVQWIKDLALSLLWLGSLLWHMFIPWPMNFRML